MAFRRWHRPMTSSAWPGNHACIHAGRSKKAWRRLIRVTDADAHHQPARVDETHPVEQTRERRKSCRNRAYAPIPASDAATPRRQKTWVRARTSLMVLTSLRGARWRRSHGWSGYIRQVLLYRMRLRTGVLLPSPTEHDAARSAAPSRPATAAVQRLSLKSAGPSVPSSDMARRSHV
jgi:hypothetical protein